MALVPLFTPDSEPELITTVAMLEAHGFFCYVRNAGFGGLYPGPQISLYNTRTVMVPEESLADARALLASIALADTDCAPQIADSRPGFIRTLLDFLFFGWFIPGRRRDK